jgi:hypothetical protein
MPHRVIIPAAGTQSRWTDDSIKHFVDVHGEPLLVRTIRQLRERNIDDIAVITTEDWDINALLLHPVRREEEVETDKLLSSADYWLPSGRTTILFGDTFFSDHAMNIIAATDHPTCTWFGRKGPGITGKPYGELFGVTFGGDLRKTVLQCFEDVRHNAAPDNALYIMRRHKIRNLRKKHIMRGDGWACWYAMEYKPWSRFTKIDDNTEDFDYVEDYQRWLDMQEV